MLIRRLLGVCSLVVLLVMAPTPAGAQQNQDFPPELEPRAQHLYRQLMCPTCPGQNISQSSAPISADMRAIVREKLLAGESNEAILAFFVEAYGESVLASPPRDGISLFVWLIPLLKLPLGGVAVFLVIRMLRKEQSAAARAQPAEAQAPLPEELAPYLEVVDSELGALEIGDSRRSAPFPSALSDRS